MPDTADFYRKLWTQAPVGAEFSHRILRILHSGRENWVRSKTADRAAFLQKPQLQ